MTRTANPLPKTEREPIAPSPQPVAQRTEKPAEHGGPKGPEPTRYGDWERNGRCSDF